MPRSYAVGDWVQSTMSHPRLDEESVRWRVEGVHGNGSQ
jgi:hypothetical protein